MARRHSSNIIGKSKQLWSELIQRAGLDLELYDRPLLEDLAETLGLPVDSFETGLRQISVERLVSAFLRAIAPYNLMMRDLLTMFAQAAAQSSNANIRIKFDFGEKIPGLDFDLRDFRQWVSQLERVSVIGLVDEWDLQRLLELEHAYTSEGVTYRYQDANWDESELPNNSQARSWLLRTSGEQHPYGLPPIPDAADETL